MVEFLVAFIPMWVFFLSMVQLALVSHASLMVKHSADAAARSAAVVLPDDPEEYGGNPENEVDQNSVSLASFGGVLSSIAAIMSNPTLSTVADAFSSRTFANLGSSRVNTIRIAAHVPLMPLAPMDIGSDRNPNLEKSIGTKQKLLKSFLYQPFAVAVTFPDAEGDKIEGPEVTVRVTYAYQCTVPLARRLVCGTFSSIQNGPTGVSSNTSGGRARAKRDDHGALMRAKSNDRDEFDSAFFPFAQAFVGGYFKRLERETTLLLHNAPYEYKPQE